MNEMRWNLDKLYTSFDSKEFKADFDAVDQKIEEIKKWSAENFKDNNNAAQKLEEYIKNETAFMEFVYPLFQFASLTTSVEAKNKDAQSYLEQLRIKFVALTQSSVMYEKWIGNLKNLDAIIDSSGFLKNFKFILKETAEKKKYLLSEKEEISIAKMRQTGSTAWSTLQNNLTANLLVDIEIDGEKKHLPLPVVRNMAHDKSSDIRKKAYEAELEAYKKIEESSAACLNAIKGERLSLSKMRGYDSIIDKV
ncbi:MAG: oligoendopeptidase F, partial [Tenericutes bacterium 4572_104]